MKTPLLRRFSLRFGSRRGVIAGGASLGLAITAIAFGLTADLYGQTLSTRRQELSRFGTLVAEVAERALQAVDLAQRDVGEDIRRSGVATDGDLAGYAATDSFHRLLQQHIAGLPQAASLSIADAGGRLLNASKRWPNAPGAIADQPYFQWAKADPSHEGLVDRVVSDPFDRTQTLLLVRRIAAPDGRFLGVILASAQLDYFGALYRAVLMGEDSSIVLAFNSGALVVRSPPAPELVGNVLAPLIMPAGTASQIVDGISPIDGKRRIVSMHALVHYPVTIAVSIDRAAVLARWWTEAALFAGAAALLDLAIAASVMLMLRHMQFQAVEAESARQDAAAEAQRDRDSAAMDIQAATDRAAILAGLATAFEHQVGQMSRAVAASAAQLQTSAITLTSLAADASEQTRSAAADAAVGAADVNRIAGATALLNQSIETVARQAGDGAAVISAAAAAVHDADATMAMLTSSAGRIGEVVNMIGDFARRTNLLALNATIEAARAGDAGRGFAVVAAEVKTLSKAVSTATDEIRRQIDGMQEATTQTAGAMQQIRSVVSMIDTITSDVTHTMEEHRRATEQIAGAISDTATGAQVLSEIINGASHAATETGATAADVQLTARILADGADGLRNASDDFLVQVQTR